MPKQKLFPVVAADLAAWLFKKPEHTRSQLIISIDRYLGRLGTLELDTRWPEVGETRINEAVRAALEERDEDATIPGGGALRTHDYSSLAPLQGPGIVSAKLRVEADKIHNVKHPHGTKGHVINPTCETCWANW